MAWAYVQSVAALADADPGEETLDLPSLTPAAEGNLLVVGFDSADEAATPTIHDTGGHTWIVGNPVFHDTPHHQTVISWYTITTTTSPIVITVESGVSINWIAVTCDEFSGGHASPLDQHSESTPAGSSGNPAVGDSVTPTYDDSLVWAFASGMITTTGNIDGSAATVGGITGGDEQSEFRILTGRSGIPMTASFVTYTPFKYNVLTLVFRPATGGAANLDTRSKRASSVNLWAPSKLALVLPDSTLDQGDRQHTAFAYSGILAAAPAGGSFQAAWARNANTVLTA